MKIISVSLITVLLSSALIVDGNDNRKLFKRMYVLEGKWIMKLKDGVIGEEWHKLDRDYLQSRGFFIKGNDTVITERVMLKNTAQGIYYTSTVTNQNNRQPVQFNLTSGAHNIFVFENPEHDFPKRIVYKIVNHDSIYAYIDGGINGPAKKEEFYYKRVK